MRVFLIISCILGPFSLYGGQVQSLVNPLPIYEKASLESPILGSIQKGKSLESRNRVGAFWEVKLREGLWGFVLFDQVRFLFFAEQRSQTFDWEEQYKEDKERYADGLLSRWRASQESYYSFDDADVRGIQDAPPNLRRVYGMESFPISQEAIRRIGELLQAELAQKKKEN